MKRERETDRNGEHAPERATRGTARLRHHDGIFPKARTRPPPSLPDESLLALSLRAEAARCLGDRTFTDEQFALYGDWSRRGWSLARGKRSGTPHPRRTFERAPRRAPRLLAPRFGPLAAFLRLRPLGHVLDARGLRNGSKFYPVVLPMSGSDRPAAHAALPNFAGETGHRLRATPTRRAPRRWHPVRCVRHFGVALYLPEIIFNERQPRFLSDLVNGMRTVISSRENLDTEPDFGGVPDWVTVRDGPDLLRAPSRAAAQVWAYHLAHRRCACGARLARDRGGNPGATCAGRPAERTMRVDGKRPPASPPAWRSTARRASCQSVETQGLSQ